MGRLPVGTETSYIHYHRAVQYFVRPSIFQNNQTEIFDDKWIQSFQEQAIIKRLIIVVILQNMYPLFSQS